ncbi:Lrp/AsnC family transcriptional regulator [Aeromicrobium endophyticum]|uniref:Lrp/AsnC family transcriptional regulator n=1 Tax=Aeromicrobium endophyticum TaxID=2292704 RepID=A0A371PAX7_9ACTN|nr:Lrp/AsnC family transcriptional regulator [Aeromicrobium endophyticum]REK73082.1 Lrp/AsnC family transcriptional regulator [Aeromicrobium endophyticum]
MLRIDRLDSQILGRLTDNARAAVADLASSLGVARNTVMSRIRRLEQTGVLSGFMPLVDLEAVGIPVQAFVALELDQRQMADVVASLSELAHVLEINTQAGREDLLARVAAPTHRELQEVVNQMIQIDGVRHTVTTMIVSTPLPFRTQPLLDRLTAEAGFGRSTPAAT